MHTIERQADQLAMAGIPETPFPDLSWLSSETSRFGLPDKYALLIPGGAAHRPEKRWPVNAYRDLAQSISERISCRLSSAGRTRSSWRQT